MNHRDSNVMDRLAELFDMTLCGRVSYKTSLFIRAAINSELEFLLEERKNDTELQEFLKKLEGISSPNEQESREELFEEPTHPASEELPKKRGRKKKEPEATLPETTVEQEESEEPTTSGFEILPPDGKRGLDKRLGTLPTLDGLTTEFCEKNNLSPLLIANTVAKKGTHPFFKGSISYLWYLPEDRRRHYMAGALNWEEEYKSFSDLCDPDKDRKEWEEHGVDMNFVSCLVTTDEHPIFTSEPKRVDEPEVIQKVKAAGGFGKIVEYLGPDGEPLVKFMARFGVNQQLFVDLLTIVKNYKEKPNAIHIPF